MVIFLFLFYRFFKERSMALYDFFLLPQIGQKELQMPYFLMKPMDKESEISVLG